MKNIIDFTAPKGEKVILSFGKVMYRYKTHNNQISLKLNYS